MRNIEVEQKENEIIKKLCDKFPEYAKLEDCKVVAIGWLDWRDEFEKGEVSLRFLNKLRILWNEGGHIGTLGYHTCEFCNGFDEDQKTPATSSCEKILVDRENKIEYHFPEMIFHYIEVHNFKPSNEFIEFVMRK